MMRPHTQKAALPVCGSTALAAGCEDCRPTSSSRPFSSRPFSSCCSSTCCPWTCCLYPCPWWSCSWNLVHAVLGHAGLGHVVLLGGGAGRALRECGTGHQGKRGGGNQKLLHGNLRL